MKKNLLIISGIFIFFIILLLCMPFVVSQHMQEIVSAKSIIFVFTIILIFLTYFMTEKHSKRIASFGTILLAVVYVLFFNTVEADNPIITGYSVMALQAAIIIFTCLSGFVIKEKTTLKFKSEAGKYISDTVLADMDKSESFRSSGVKEVLTVMFIDIRGFTTIAEEMPAEEVTRTLNEYFREVIPSIKKYGGVINKFVGDAVLAVFADEDTAHGAQNALRAGKEILRKLKNFRIMREAEGKSPITAGIGINTGEVFLGYIGNEERQEYTVIGDNVNLAYRTEAANKVYKTQFLITEKTYQYIKNTADVIKITDAEMKGKREKVTVYEVLRVAEAE